MSFCSDALKVAAVASLSLMSILMEIPFVEMDVLRI
jgi:hypothetical protein